MQFRVGAAIADDTVGPADACARSPTWVAQRPADARAQVEVHHRQGPACRSWLVNGKTFDPARSDAMPVLDTTETWELHNATKVAHLIHLHHTDWYMLSRNGRPPPPWERCLKETFFLDPGDRVVVAGHFCDSPGKYVIHCHMLDHEDHGLMSQFEVVAA